MRLTALLVEVRRLIFSRKLCFGRRKMDEGSGAVHRLVRGVELLACAVFVMVGIVVSADEGIARTSPSLADLAAQSSQEDDIENEIIVMEERAKSVPFKFNIDDRTRRVKCKIVRSSGDKAFDNAMCQPIHRCANVEPFDAPTVNACITVERERVFREFAEARRAQ